MKLLTYLALHIVKVCKKNRNRNNGMCKNMYLSFLLQCILEDMSVTSFKELRNHRNSFRFNFSYTPCTWFLIMRICKRNSLPVVSQSLNIICMHFGVRFHTWGTVLTSGINSHFCYSVHFKANSMLIIRWNSFVTYLSICCQISSFVDWPADGWFILKSFAPGWILASKTCAMPF